MLFSSANGYRIIIIELSRYDCLLRPFTFLLCNDENTGLFISPCGISELDCATTKTDTAERIKLDYNKSHCRVMKLYFHKVMVLSCANYSL